MASPEPFGLTLDTGALIALERGDKKMRTALLLAEQQDRVITLSTAVVAEWWRGGNGRQHRILDTLDIEPVSFVLARLAGEAQAAVPGATAIDALVMASAAQRGDVVYTSDFSDLDRLHAYFPAVRAVVRV